MFTDSTMTTKNGISRETVSAESLLNAAKAERANRNFGLSKSYSYTSEVTETAAEIQFNSADGQAYNGTHETGNSPSAYVEAFTESLDATLNDSSFIDALRESGVGIEVRPARTQATPIVIHEMKDRTVYFDSSKNFISAADAPIGSIGDGTISAGSEIHISKTDKSAGFSFSTRIYDHVISTNGFTESTLHIALQNACNEITESLCGAIANVLSVAPGAENVQVKPLTTTGKTAAEVSETIVDIITMNVSKTGYADKISEVALVMPVGVEAILEREAQAKGFTDIEAMLGCSVLGYKPNDIAGTAIYIISKRMVALSFATMKDGSGRILAIQATRDPAHQAWTIEAFGSLDVLADAGVTVDDKGVESKTTIKHIVKITFDGTTEAAVSIPGVTA